MNFFPLYTHTLFCFCPLPVLVNYHLTFSLSAVSKNHGDFPNAASRTTRSSSWKVEALVCLTNRPRLEAAPLCPFPHVSHVINLTLSSNALVLSCAAVRDNSVWEWICRGGRGVWLRRASGECTSASHVCLLWSCLLRWVMACSLFVCRSATRNAARSVPSPTGRTAATAPAAITHVWYELCVFLNI